MRRLHLVRLTALLAATSIVVAACSSGSSVSAGSSSTSGGQGSSAFTAAPATTPPGGLKVSEHDFVLALASNTVAAGNVAVTIDNQGPSSHELLAFRTNLPDDQLPLGSDGRIKEDALPKIVDTGTDVAPGTQRSLSASLTPGRYVLVCNLPGHYRAGMHAVLIVA